MSPKHNQGFTLIELLVVISIISLLSSVVLSSLNSARAKARDTRRMTDMRQIQTALELYYDMNGRYPVPAGGDDTWSGHCYGYGNYDTYIIGISAYMARLPIDPTYDVGSQCYLYRTANSGADYKLLAHGTTESVCPVPSTHPFYDASRAGQCTFQISSPGFPAGQ
jgi:type II secretion system protein G